LEVTGDWDVEGTSSGKKSCDAPQEADGYEYYEVDRLLGKD
jgi:hypothetical protein